MYYPLYNGPVYYNAPIIQHVDDATLQDYIKKQMYESDLPSLPLSSFPPSLLPSSFSLLILLHQSSLSPSSEYYFSDENLQKDFFLRGQVRIKKSI